MVNEKPSEPSKAGKPKEYFLDPDFRREPPDEGAYCVRCQKPIHDPAKAIRVTVDWERVRVKEGGDELMGRDCWKAISGELTNAQR